jgi:hypothetical protein
MQDQGTFSFNISKDEFLRKLREVTIEMDLESINDRRDIDISATGGKLHFFRDMKIIINQDYDAMNRKYDFGVDIVASSENCDRKIFLGEINENSARLYLPNYIYEGNKTKAMIDSLDERVKNGLKHLAENFRELDNYIYLKTQFHPIDFSRSYAMELSINETNTRQVSFSFKMVGLKYLRKTFCFRSKKDDSNYLNYAGYRYYLPNIGKFWPFSSKIAFFSTALCILLVCSADLFPDYVVKGSWLHSKLIFAAAINIVLVGFISFVVDKKKLFKKINEYLELEMQTYKNCLDFVQKGS